MSPLNKLRILTISAAACLMVGSAFGQGRGGGGGAAPPPTGSTGTGSTGTTTPGTTGRPTIPTLPTNPNPTQQPTYQPPIFISGRVMLEDGTPPPEQVVIERVCNGQPHSEGYTDAKGYFGIELGRRNGGVLQDASENSSAFDMGPGFPQSNQPGFGSASPSAMGISGDMRYNNCEIRARLAGYRSQVVNLVNRRSMDNPDIGVILLHRLGGAVEGTTISASTLSAPKDARKAFLKGQEAMKKNRPDEAVKDFGKAVQVHPKFAAAWNELGKSQARMGLEEEAHKSFEDAIKADSKFLPAYIELAVMDLTAGKWQQLADITSQAMKLDAFDYPQAYFLNAVANYNLQNLGAAELSARETERLDTRHQYPKTSQLLGMILAQRHDYMGAAEEFRNYLKFAPQAPDAEKVKEQLDRVEKASAGDMPRVVNRDQQ